MRRLAMGMALMGLFLVPGLSKALGLGDIEVLSALNQPLHAEIELISVREGEMEDLQVRLAPEALYQRLGVERTGLLSQLRFQPETLQDGRHVIRVTTRDQLREPFVNFLIEASWPAGRLVREYTMLLDPPAMFEAREAPAPTGRPAESRPAPALAQRAEPPRRDAPDSYRVQRGDTLWNIARDLRPDAGVSVEQMMLALLRSNPDAFADSNINNLRSGEVLRVPERDEINRLSGADANREVARQHRLWQELRTAAARDTRPQVPAPSAPVAGEPSPPVSEPSQPVTTDDARLEILAAREADGAVAELEQELALAQETAAARTREVEELRSRVAELEGLLERSERLLELNNQQMAELQARMDRIEGREPVVSEPAPDVAAAPETADPGPEVAPAPDMADDASVVIMSESERMAAAATPATSEESESAAVPATSEQPEAAPMPAAPAAPESREPRAAAPQAPADPVRPTSMMDDLMASPYALLIVGLVILLILMLIWRMFRGGGGSRADEPALATASALGTEPRLDSAATGALAGAAAGGMAAGALAADRGEGRNEAEGEVAEAHAPGSAEEAEVLAEGESPAAVSEQHGEIINDDTIAEVDVYLAYGLYNQAEDLLNKAVSENPGRVDYRFKLAETHFATRNTEAFEANAEKMHEALGGRPSQLWERVQSMGQDLAPGNALFSGAASLEHGAGETTGEVDLDLGMGDLGDSLKDMEIDHDLEEAARTEESVPVAEETVEDSGDLEEGPANVDDEALEFDLGDLELGADELDVELLDEGDGDSDTRIVHESAEESATAGEATSGADDTILDEVGEVPTGAGLSADDTQLMEEDFSDLDFMGGEDTDDLLMSDDEAAELPSGDEVSTKLDLARAYIDMGDAEGARSTLEEVLAEGNDAQKSEAQGLLDQLG